MGHGYVAEREPNVRAAAPRVSPAGTPGGEPGGDVGEVVINRRGEPVTALEW